MRLPAESGIKTDAQQLQLLPVQLPAPVGIHGIEQLPRCLYPRRIFNATQRLPLELLGIPVHSHSEQSAPQRNRLPAGSPVYLRQERGSLFRGGCCFLCLSVCSHLFFPQQTHRPFISIQKTRGCFRFPVAM